MIDLTIFGLSIVLISWIIQVLGINKRREISKGFIITYMVGVLFLAIDAYHLKKIDIAIINAVIILIAAIVLFKFSKPKKWY